ncbi:MAG: arsenate reductase family protein [Flavobacteriaceae bacterium]|tara:strand:- start:2190 stop:2534 length:345 start_codon:yes stop_codon:yes gene_type:complete
MKYIIYHNPRCRKSREALKYLQDKGYDFEIKDYIKNLLSLEEIVELIESLNIKPIELVRKNEAIWKENFKNKDLDDNQIINALSKYPKLIERPIVTKGKSSIIAKPIDKLLNFL